LLSKAAWICFFFRISNVSQRLLHPITQEVCG
jgi:hypothetical protein